MLLEKSDRALCELSHVGNENIESSELSSGCSHWWNMSGWPDLLLTFPSSCRFFFKKVFLCLAAPCLSCGTQNL